MTPENFIELFFTEVDISDHGFPLPIVTGGDVYLRGVSVVLDSGRQVLCVCSYAQAALHHLTSENRTLSRLAHERLEELITHLPAQYD